MSLFFKHFSEDVGASGRNGGAIFYVTIVSGFAIVIGGIFLMDCVGQDIYFRIQNSIPHSPYLDASAPYLVAAVTFTVVYLVARKILKPRRLVRRPEIRPMSREELRLARSKLLGNQLPKKL